MGLGRGVRRQACTAPSQPPPPTARRSPPHPLRNTLDQPRPPTPQGLIRQKDAELEQRGALLLKTKVGGLRRPRREASRRFKVGRSPHLPPP